MTKAIDYASRIVYGSKDTLLFTYEQAKKYADHDGVYVECGVAAGAHIIAMAEAAPHKTIYAFDSFEGIPLPSNRDDQYPGIRIISREEQKRLPKPGKQELESSGATVYSIGQFWENIQKSKVSPTNIITVKGWFERTMPTINMPKIAILRLDADLYHSTFISLKYLFQQVIPGGCVIIDDWNLTGCQQACKDYFKSIGHTPNYQFNAGIAYFYV